MTLIKFLKKIQSVHATGMPPGIYVSMTTTTRQTDGQITNNIDDMRISGTESSSVSLGHTK